jgi:hypothetical protein
MRGSSEIQYRTTNIIRRIARIWSAVIIGLGILVFIAEIIEATTTELAPYPFYENLIPFTLFTGILGLVLAWRWEGVGGGITVLSVIANLVVYLFTGRTAVGVVVLILTPILIPGLLFLVCWMRSRGEEGALID